MFPWSFFYWDIQVLRSSRVFGSTASVLPKETLTCGQLQLGFEPPTLQVWSDDVLLCSPFPTLKSLPLKHLFFSHSPLLAFIGLTLICSPRLPCLLFPFLLFFSAPFITECSTPHSSSPPVRRAHWWLLCRVTLSPAQLQPEGELGEVDPSSEMFLLSVTGVGLFSQSVTQYFYYFPLV